MYIILETLKRKDISPLKMSSSRRISARLADTSSPTAGPPAPPSGRQTPPPQVTPPVNATGNEATATPVPVVSNEELHDNFNTWSPHTKCPKCTKVATIKQYQYQQQTHYKCIARGDNGKECGHKYDQAALKRLVVTFDYTIAPPPSDLPMATGFPRQTATPVVSAPLMQLPITENMDPQVMMPVLLQTLNRVIVLLEQSEARNAEFQAQNAGYLKRLENLERGKGTSSRPTSGTGSAPSLTWSPRPPMMTSSPSTATATAPKPTAPPRGPRSWSQVVNRYKPEQRPQVEEILRSLHNFNPVKPVTRTEQKLKLRTVVVGMTIQSKPLKDVKNELHVLGYKMKNILQLTNCGKNLWELLVREEYAHECIKRSEDLRFQVIKGYNAAEPLNKKMSEEERAAFNIRVQKRIATTIFHCKIDDVTEFQKNLAAEMGWTSEVDAMVTAMRADKEKKTANSTAAAAAPSSSQATGTFPTPTQPATATSADAAATTPTDVNMAASTTAAPVPAESAADRLQALGVPEKIVWSEDESAMDTTPAAPQIAGNSDE